MDGLYLFHTNIIAYTNFHDTKIKSNASFQNIFTNYEMWDTFNGSILHDHSITMDES